MKGLLLKDIYTILNNKKQFLWLLAMGIAFTFFFNDGGNYFSTMISLGLLMSVYSSFTYDDSAHWNQFAVTLPVKRSHIVLSKYVLSLICLLAGFILIALFSTGIAVFGDSGTVWDNFSASLISIAVMLFALAFALPFIYKVGVEKARFVMMGGILIPLLAVILLYQFWPGLFAAEQALGGILIVLIAALILLVLPLSFFISLKIYAAKEF